MPPILGSNLMQMYSTVTLRIFPYHSALLGFVSYSDPCWCVGWFQPKIKRKNTEMEKNPFRIWTVSSKQTGKVPLSKGWFPVQASKNQDSNRPTKRRFDKTGTKRNATFIFFWRRKHIQTLRSFNSSDIFFVYIRFVVVVPFFFRRKPSNEGAFFVLPSQLNGAECLGFELVEKGLKR